MSEARERIAELYFRSNSAKFGRFPLSIHLDRPDLPPSPYYLHYPQAGEPGSELLPELFDLVGQGFFDLCGSKGIRPQKIAAVPNGANPLARAHARRHPAYPDNLLVFAKTTDGNITRFHGPIEGMFEPGDNLVVDEDHTSAGRNKLLFLRAAQCLGFTVTDMLTVVDRQQQGPENLAEVGVTLHSLFTATELLEAGQAMGFATAAQLAEAQEYIAANQYTL
jgi:uridine monophosphate synthetase